MPTLSILPSVYYSYEDSGAPSVESYETLVVIHGNTYHGATFEPLFSPALCANLRIITINRRGYPGSSPFTKSEIETMTSTSSSTLDLERFFKSHSKNLGLFIDKVVTEIGLPDGKNVTICGWSNGGIFALGVIAFVDEKVDGDVGDEIGELRTEAEEEEMGELEKVTRRLREKIKGVLLWDPPSICFGVLPPPDTYVPLYDQEIAAEDRGKVFGLWVASYFKHADITSHSIADLAQRDAQTEPKPSTTRMTASQFLTVTDLEGGGYWDTVIVDHRYMEVYRRQAEMALFKILYRKSKAHGDDARTWDFDVCVLVGEANPWPVIYGMWAVEDLAAYEGLDGVVKKKREVGYKIMNGANHFVFWDNPKATIGVLRECVLGDMRSVVVDPVDVQVHGST